MLDAERGGGCPGGSHGIDDTVLTHLVDDPVAAAHCAFRMAIGIVVVGCFRQGCEEGCLRNREFAYRLVEIGECGLCHAVGAAPKIDVVEIELENAVLGVGLVDPQREDRFAQLAFNRAVRRQEEILGDLLRDRRAADHAPAGTVIGKIGQERRGDARNVDTGMEVEILILGRKECLADTRGNRADRQEKPAFAREFSDHRTVARIEAGGDRGFPVRERAVIGQVSRQRRDDRGRRERDDGREIEGCAKQTCDELHKGGTDLWGKRKAWPARMPVRRAAYLERLRRHPRCRLPSDAGGLWPGKTTHGIDPRKRRGRPHLPELMLPSDSGVSR